MEKEEWRDIKGYEGLYQISNFGRVKSLEKPMFSNFKNCPDTIRKERLLAISTNKYGYKCLTLKKHGIGKQKRINRLVMEAFCPDKTKFKYMPHEDPKKIDLDMLVVNHKDENKLNNYVKNLEWCTRCYNSNYGTMPMRMREKNRINFRPVFKCDLEGNILERFECCSDAAKSVGCRTWDIILCADENKSRITAKGYKWKFDTSEK